MDTYWKNNYICGCDTVNILFCFPQIIFNRSSEISWSKLIIDDSYHLPTKFKSYEKTQTHILVFNNSCTAYYFPYKPPLNMVHIILFDLICECFAFKCFTITIILIEIERFNIFSRLR